MFLTCSRLILGSCFSFYSGFFAYSKIIDSIVWEGWVASATTSLTLVLIRQKATMLRELLFVSLEKYTHSNISKGSVLPFNIYGVRTEYPSRTRKLI